MERKPKICVIGAGVIGVTSAFCIQEQVPGTEVTIIADTFSPSTTSDGSAGFWLPFLVSQQEAQRVK
ncbi:hypothetical protein FSP39_008105 [Pinctada imbricata]|uniref:FAD dependent oxidoreductase domain-containing protein n=1 Tax=Pinctada imbricata TaxID=66713 RepID=A0AA89BWF6_PINIB|nr:hypothetical protein FSP39_008105 [Pinctada imbricata]